MNPQEELPWILQVQAFLYPLYRARDPLSTRLVYGKSPFREGAFGLRSTASGILGFSLGVFGFRMTSGKNWGIGFRALSDPSTPQNCSEDSKTAPMGR